MKTIEIELEKLDGHKVDVWEKMRNLKRQEEEDATDMDMDVTEVQVSPVLVQLPPMSQEEEESLTMETSEGYDHPTLSEGLSDQAEEKIVEDTLLSETANAMEGLASPQNEEVDDFVML